MSIRINLRKRLKRWRHLPTKYPNDLRYRVTIGRMLLVTGREKDGLNVLILFLKMNQTIRWPRWSSWIIIRIRGLDSLYNSMLYQVLTSKNTETADR